MTESESGAARRGAGAAGQRASTASATSGPTTGSTTARGSERGAARSTSTSADRTAARESVVPTRRDASKGLTTGTRTAAQNGGQSGGQTGSRTPASGPAAKRPASRKPRRAQLRLSEVDAWSVTKTAFLLSIALGIVTVVAVGIVWGVLGAAGVFDSVNNSVQAVLGNNFRAQDYLGTGRVLGFTMLLAVANVVLLTAIATLTAFLYNLAAILLGGVELTLTEDG